MPDAPRKLRVFVADDHPILLEALRLLIAAQDDMELVGDAEDGASVVAAVVASSPDVVVMDVSMPLVGGPDATRRLHRECPAVKVLALSAYPERIYVDEMLDAGASGYLTKGAAVDELPRTIREIARGETYLDAALPPPAPARRAADRAPPTDDPLDGREEEVLRSIARGHALKEIAAAMRLSVPSVETLRARAMQKLGLASRADVVRLAMERGWLSAP